MRVPHRQPKRSRAIWGRAFAVAALLAGPPAAPVYSDEAATAKIVVTSATAGSSLGGRLVEGRLTFRGHEYLLRLQGLAESANTTGTVNGLLRPRDVAGAYERVDGAFRNTSGVTIRFEPPIVLGGDRLVIEMGHRMQPKVSGGHHESGVE